MNDNEPKMQKIPVLKDVVIPVVQPEKANATHEQIHEPIAAEPSLLSSTLQAEIDAIVNQARADFEATIAQLLEEMEQRIERELRELHLQLNSDD